MKLMTAFLFAIVAMVLLVPPAAQAKHHRLKHHVAHHKAHHAAHHHHHVV